MFVSAQGPVADRPLQLLARGKKRKGLERRSGVTDLVTAGHSYCSQGRGAKGGTWDCYSVAAGRRGSLPTEEMLPSQGARGGWFSDHTPGTGCRCQSKAVLLWFLW